MKTTTLILLLFPFFLFAQSCTIATIVDDTYIDTSAIVLDTYKPVGIHIGQSNTVGIAYCGSLDQKYQTVQKGKIFNGMWGGLEPCQNTQYGSGLPTPVLGSIETELNYDLSEATALNWYTFKYARNGAGFAEQNGWDWNINSVGEGWDEFQTNWINAKTQAKTNGLFVNPEYLYIFGGESDADSQIEAEAVEENLSKLVDGIRELVCIPDLFIIVVRISPETPYPFASTVRSQLASFVSNDINAVLIDTDGLDRNADGIHLATQGHKDLEDLVLPLILQGRTSPF